MDSINDLFRHIRPLESSSTAVKNKKQINRQVVSPYLKTIIGATQLQESATEAPESLLTEKRLSAKFPGQTGLRTVFIFPARLGSKLSETREDHPQAPDKTPDAGHPIEKPLFGGRNDK